MSPRIDWSDGGPDAPGEDGTTIYPRVILLGSILPVLSIVVAVVCWLHLGSGPGAVREAVLALAVIATIFPVVFLLALLLAMLRVRSITKRRDGQR